MARYTLGKETELGGLFVVLDDGKLTQARASKGAILKDSAEIKGGIIKGGTILGGTIWGGTIRGGTIRGGTIWGGTIRGGTIEGGTIWGGTIWGGTIRGGTIWGGTIEGGTIRGGTIRGGTIKEGYINFFASLVEGSDLNIPDGKHIKIGCQEHTPNHWLENYKEIAKENDFPSEYVEPYYQLILVAKGLIDANNKDKG